MTAQRITQPFLVLGAASVAAGAWLISAPAASAQNCAPGFAPNPYTVECLAPVNTPTISGVPCVASKIALCSSFVQNLQPRRGLLPVS